MDNFTLEELDRLHISLIGLAEEYAASKKLEQSALELYNLGLDISTKEKADFFSAESKKMANAIVDILFSVNCENQDEYEHHVNLVKRLIESDQNWVDDFEMELSRRTVLNPDDYTAVIKLNTMRDEAKKRIKLIFEDEVRITRLFQEAILSKRVRGKHVTENSGGDLAILQQNLASISAYFHIDNLGRKAVGDLFKEAKIPESLDVILKGINFVKRALISSGITKEIAEREGIPQDEVERSPRTSLAVIAREIDLLVLIGDENMNPIYDQNGLNRSNPVAKELKRLVIERLGKEIQIAEEKQIAVGATKRLSEPRAFNRLFSYIVKDSQISSDCERLFSQFDDPKLSFPGAYPPHHQYMIDQLNMIFLLEELETNQEFPLESLVYALKTLKSFYSKNGSLIGLLNYENSMVQRLKKVVVEKLKTAFKEGKLPRDAQDDHPFVVLFSYLIDLRTWERYKKESLDPINKSRLTDWKGQPLKILPKDFKSGFIEEVISSL